MEKRGEKNMRKIMDGRRRRSSLVKTRRLMTKKWQLSEQLERGGKHDHSRRSRHSLHPARPRCGVRRRRPRPCRGRLRSARKPAPGDAGASRRPGGPGDRAGGRDDPGSQATSQQAQPTNVAGPAVTAGELEVATTQGNGSEAGASSANGASTTQVAGQGQAAVPDETAQAPGAPT